jgi:hypothetical protein
MREVRPMRPRLRLAFWCYLLALALLGGFGLVYLVTPRFMPYHAEAIGTAWDDLSAVYQVQMLGFLRSIAAGFLGTVIAGSFVLFGPFREGRPWARWAMFATGLVVSAVMLWGTLMVTLNTPATPPWMAAVAGLVLTLSGFLLSTTRETETLHHVEETRTGIGVE